MRTVLEYFNIVLVPSLLLGLLLHGISLWRGSVEKHLGVAGLLLSGAIFLMCLEGLPDNDIRTVVFLSVECILFVLGMALGAQHYRLKWMRRPGSPQAGPPVSPRVG